MKTDKRFLGPIIQVDELHKHFEMYEHHHGACAPTSALQLLHTPILLSNLLPLVDFCPLFFCRQLIAAVT